MKKFVWGALALSSIGLTAKVVKFQNKTDSGIVLTITPGRSGKMQFSSKPFQVNIPTNSIMPVTIYSEKLGGKGDYIKKLAVNWSKPGKEIAGGTEVDLKYLNTFIQSDMDKSQADPVGISFRPLNIIRGRRWEETPDKYFVVKVPDVPRLKEQLTAERIKTEKQVRRAGHQLERLGRTWLGLKPKR